MTLLGLCSAGHVHLTFLQGCCAGGRYATWLVGWLWGGAKCTMLDLRAVPIDGRLVWL